MRPLGKVVNFSPKGSIVVKAVITPSIGQTAADRRGGQIGRIIRITGPVDAPYVMIKPFGSRDGQLQNLGGKELFIAEDEESRSRRNRTGKAERSDRSAGGRKRSKRNSGDGDRRDRRPGSGGRRKDRRGPP
ncbi:MAG: hypothetical protein ACMUIE_03495 [Thermoplasmatota archaeon]